MYIYIFIYFILVLFALLYPKGKVYSVIACILLCILVFFRGSTVGTDVASYSVNFRKINWSENSWNYLIPFEPGFNYFILYFKYYILNNPMACWGLIGIIYTLSFYKLARKYTRNINVAILCFYALGTYLLAFNIMRQCFACAFIFLLLSYIDINNPTRKDLLVFTIFVFIIGLLLHPTMFIFYIYYLYHIKIFNKILTKKIMVLSISISFIIFYKQAIIPFITSFIETSTLEGKLINYAIRNIQNDENSGFSLLKILLINTFQIYLIISSTNTKNIFLFIGTFGVIFLNCFGILVVEFARVYELLICLQIIYLAQIWDTPQYNILTKLYKPILFAYLTVTFINIVIKNYGEIVPYRFRF